MSLEKECFVAKAGKQAVCSDAERAAIERQLREGVLGTSDLITVALVKRLREGLSSHSGAETTAIERQLTEGRLGCARLGNACAENWHNK